MEINKIHNEDCLTTMSKMDDNFVDMIITSPPYDNLRDYNGFSFEFENIAKELFRILKVGGVLVWNVNDQTIDGCESLTSFKQAIFFVENCGFKLHDTMIYLKDKSVFPESNRYGQIFEYMFVFSKGKPKTTNLIKDRKNKKVKINKGTQRQKNGDKKRLKNIILDEYGSRNNVWFYPNGFQKSSKDKIAFEHPAIMPEQMAKDHIYTWSNEKDLIYDPFMGSGTTAKSSHLLKRNWIGSELSYEYVVLANKRLKPYLNQLTMF